MTDAIIVGIPEEGQLVEVRRRRYVVTGVAESSAPPDPLAPGNGQGHHLVTLSSVEDDGQGEELQVIWELEPGARIHEQMALPVPDGFDPPHRLDAFLNAVRWGAGASADVRALQSPFRSGIDIEDYQLDPVVRALGMPRVNLLIADDVGLGKTVEAGLVIQELMIRNRARRVLIVCPAALQIQWRDQMRDKFGLEFRIVDSALMKELRRKRGIHVNPWSHFPRLITSIEFLKRDRALRLFRELLPPEGEVAYPRRFDVLVVDEAHNVAPAGRGAYAIDSERTAAIRLLAPHFEHKLFLTATPHNGYAESFSALLELVDNQRFARGVPPDRKLLASVMVRRLKSELPPNWDGSPRFPQRRLEAIEVAYSEEERQAHRWLQEYTTLRQQSADGPAERTATEFTLKLLKKRLFSSPAAFASTLAKHEQALAEAGKGAASNRPPRPSLPILRAMIDMAEEDYGDESEQEDATEAALRAGAQVVRPPSPKEGELLARMRDWAKRASARADSKAQALFAWLDSHIRPGGQWGDERVIIFTEYRATQNWLLGLLAARGFTQGDRLLTLYGGMDSSQRERVKAAFLASAKDSPVRILLATDAASEGIDLQLHCCRLIHYEIPWNPSRMEQRNGRIDRHGQTRNPLIYHFVPSGYQQRALGFDGAWQLEDELEFLYVAARKVEQIREDLGKVGPVIADQVAEAMLGRRAHLDTRQAEQAAEPLRRMLKFERDLRAQVRRLHEQLDETRQALDLTPENVQAAVQVALELAGQMPLEEVEVEGIWPDPSGQRTACPVFRLPPLRGSWAQCAEGLAHPHTGAVRPIVFDHNLARGRDDVVLAHLNHRLVQMSLRLLRAEVWASLGTHRLHRVTARLVRDGVLRDPAVVAHARLVMTGGGGHRLHEELIAAGGTLSEGRFRRLSVSEVQAALAGALPAEAPQEVKRRFAGLWRGVQPSLQQAIEARARERTAALEKLLAERAGQEEQHIGAVLRELEQTIRTRLDEPECVQLELFTPSEREQYSRNVAALRARLAQIPGELEQETAAIRARYAAPQARVFPVAVTFLVPMRMAHPGGH